MQLPFGKYTGQEIETIPTEYLKWFEKNVTCSIQIREAVNTELKMRSSDITSHGNSPESPRVLTLEELLYKEIIKWMIQEESIQRLHRTVGSTAILEKSLATMLKNEVPRLKKLYREQGK